MDLANSAIIQQKSPAENTGRKTEKGTPHLSCCYFHKQEHSFLQPASTPTGKKEIETLQLNYFETNIFLLPYPNSPESTAALPATAISLSKASPHSEDVLFLHLKA